MAMIRGTRVGAVGAGTAVVLSLAACSRADGAPPGGMPAVVLILLALIGVSGTAVVTFLAGWIVYATLGGLSRLMLGRPRARSSGDQEGGDVADRTDTAEPAPPRPADVWRLAREGFDRVRAEYAAYECDPLRVLQLPVLADVSVASTARFVEAFAEAQALETDAYPPPEHAERFTAAADRAARAWTAAHDAAERMRFAALGPLERRVVQRVIKLLTVARESDSEPERLAAYARARSDLAELERAGVLQLPRPARLALDVAARGQLPGPPDEPALQRPDGA